ncbi:PREDICTED: uncharacterized protein LOC106115707 [Papilio xuthus]|uniref:Uncharacterized protein LOC106115707 n=1 Tax=Papilio xuthus TaxID=66420 RepID=A0AAJ6Z3F7_PAPXU|nr:PREDICTED: uncharacterized protein LOC106115707 [Papilio xuthus]
MGLVQSLMCAIVLCFERVVSWMCCAMVLVVILVMIVVLTLYGITLGYHYAQKEIARFASGEEASGGRSGSELLREGDTQQQEVVEPLVRLVAVNRTQHETSGDVPGSFEGRTVSAQPLYLESTPTPLVVLESERPIKEVELTPHEKELALKLIGRFRRIKRNNYTSYSPPTLIHDDSTTSAA